MLVQVFPTLLKPACPAVMGFIPICPTSRTKVSSSHLAAGSPGIRFDGRHYPSINEAGRKSAQYYFEEMQMPHR